MLPNSARRTHDERSYHIAAAFSRLAVRTSCDDRDERPLTEGLQVTTTVTSGPDPATSMPSSPTTVKPTSPIANFARFIHSCCDMALSSEPQWKAGPAACAEVAANTPIVAMTKQRFFMIQQLF